MNQRLKRILLGNFKSFKMSVFFIVIAGVMISISISLTMVSQISIGPIRLNLDYMFYIVFGIFFGVFFGSGFAIINDTLKMLLPMSGGFGSWTWEYAIVTNMSIVILAALGKELLFNSKRYWFSSIIFIFILTDLFAIIAAVVSSTTSFSFKNDNFVTLIIIFSFLPFLPLTQIILVVIFLRKKNENIKKMINIVAIVLLVLVGVHWLWDPIAWMNYKNRVHGTAITLSYYKHILLAHILKSIPMAFVWTIFIYSSYEIIDLSLKKILSNRWE